MVIHVTVVLHQVLKMYFKNINNLARLQKSNNVQIFIIGCTHKLKASFFS